MKSLKMFIALTVIVSQVLWSINGYANPVDPTITSGSAAISSSGNTETINQTTNQLITNWQSFSIAAGETTRFIQPSSSSVALNRVIGSSPSEIFGALSANGRVFLINQNGILFAPGSQVNVGGLVASTLNITDTQFLNGQYDFIGANGFGSVINQGTININAPGGYAALLGSNVQNTGAIVTTAGNVVLAMGNEIDVSLDSSGAISAVYIPTGVSSNSSGSTDGIFNSGTITANGGNVILTAQSLQGLFTNLINNTGIIEASSVSSQGGQVQLMASGTQITNSGFITADNIQAQAVGADFNNQGTIEAQDSISITADGNINLPGGSLWVTSLNAGDIILDGNDVNIGGPIIAEAGDVTINAQNQILNIGGPNAGNIIANNIAVSAVNGIGTTGSLNIEVSNLNAFNSTSGKIDITSTGSFNAVSVVNNGGGLGDDISLQTTVGAPRDINVGTVKAAGLGNVTLNATGNINAINSNSTITANNLSLIANNNIGSSASRINTNANYISAVSQIVGNIYLKQATAVTLSDLFADDGLIDVIANGQITADNVTTGGGAGNSINLQTLFGDIDVGTVSAAGGLGNVTLNSAGNINDINANSMITANNLNLSAGINGSSVGLQLFLGGAISGTYVVNGHQVLVIDNQPGALSYDIYSRTGIAPPGPWQEVATNVSASDGSTTIWTDPAAAGVSGSYYVQVALAQTSNIGSIAQAVNTNVNKISADSQNVGNIYLSQAAQSVALSNITTAAGSINVNSAGSMDLGAINAAGGAGDVNLNSATNITNNSGHGLVTANNFNFTSGDVVGTQAAVNLQVINGNVVLNIQNSGNSAAYNIYSRASLTAPWQLVASGVPASSTASTQWIGPPASGPSGFYMVQTSSATTSAVGTSTNPINTKVNKITGLTNAGPGNIYLNSVGPVTLANLYATNGMIDVIAAGDMTVQKVATGAGPANSITLTTTSGNIDVGTVDAAGGSGNVNLSAAASITNNTGNGLVTANDFNFTSGNVVGTGAAVIPSIVNGDIVLTIENSNGNASYNIYSSSTLGGTMQLVATVTASTGASTIWIGPSVASAPSGFYTVTIASASTSNVGTSTNPINTFVNTINGQANAGTASGIDIDQGAQPLTIANLNAATGPINVSSARRMYAENVTTGGGAADSINLSTSIGGIDTGTINAAGGLGNVTLNAAASITNNSGTGMITGNDLTFTSGNIVGSGALVTPEIVNGNIVLLIQNPIEAQSYNIYSVVLGQAPQLIATIPASAGASTIWVGPAVGSAPSAYFTVSIASAAGVGTSTNPINTNVNAINGQANAPTGGIYINQAKAVTLSDLITTNGSINVVSAGDISVGNVNSAGNLYLDSVNGSILGIGGGTNVTSGGDAHLTAGNVIGSWDPYLPLNVNVGGDLYLAIGQRNSSASGSVGTMGVSGTLAGTVGGAYHFAPGTYAPYNSINNIFNGNPPGYIFLNKIEIWPDLALPLFVNNNDSLADSQITNSLQPNQSVYYEKQRRHLIRPDEIAAPLSIDAYHATLSNNSLAVDHVQVAPEAYDYIDARINLSTSAVPVIQIQGQK